MIPGEDPLMNQVRQALTEAGQIVLDSSVNKSQIEKKSDKNYVTEIDYKVQTYLAARLREILPGSHLIAEETAVNQFEVSRPTWILDPVDGTTNLIFDLKLSTISLALYLDGQPAYGFIYNPYLCELFQARTGTGAFLGDLPIHASATTELSKALMGFGTNPYDRDHSQQTFSILQEIFARTLEIRRSGSAALDLAYVACGRLDGFFEQMLQPWDFAAGYIIIKAAGGRIGTWLGDDLSDLLTPSSILAGGAGIFDQLKEIVNKHTS
jgi:myo-inositol-1(or 4)-monophosphatase